VACFTDQENDPESGLQYFGARYYDPWVGRFMSQDPELIGHQEGLSFSLIPEDPQNNNLYTYVLNRPTVMVDPNGEAGVYFGWSTQGGAGAGGAVTTAYGVDSKGNIDRITLTAGGGYGGAGVSTGPTLGFHTASTNKDLEGGPGLQAGFSVGTPTGLSASAGAEYVAGSEATGGDTYHGVEINAGVGVSAAPAEAHGFISGAEVENITSAGEIADKVGKGLSAGGGAVNRAIDTAGSHFDAAVDRVVSFISKLF
jgi:RHS repeat-associated protein